MLFPRDFLLGLFLQDLLLLLFSLVEKPAYSLLTATGSPEGKSLLNVVLLSPGNTLLISVSDPEWEPGGVRGSIEDGDVDRNPGRLGLLLKWWWWLLLLRRAARVTFFPDIFRLPLWSRWWWLRFPEIRAVDPRVVVDEIKVPPDMLLLLLKLLLLWLWWVPCSCIALDIGMHGKHSDSMSMASVVFERDNNKSSFWVLMSREEKEEGSRRSSTWSSTIMFCDFDVMWENYCCFVNLKPMLRSQTSLMLCSAKQSMEKIDEREEYYVSYWIFVQIRTRKWFNRFNGRSQDHVSEKN